MTISRLQRMWLNAGSPVSCLFMTRAHHLLVFCLLVCCALMAAIASPAGAEEVKGYNDWRFDLNLYGWLYGLEGDVSGRGRTASVDVTVDDAFHLIDDISFVLMGRFEVSKGPWGFLLDGSFLELEDSAQKERQLRVPILVLPKLAIRGEVDVTSDTDIFEGSLSYDVTTSPCMVGNLPELTLEVLAGARYIYVASEVDLKIQGPLGRTRSFSADKSQNWVDPIVGARVLWRPTDQWQMSFRTDLGGFGLASDITLNLNAEVAYRITKGLYVNAGYRALYYDYEEGSGNDEFAMDLWFHGPVMGVGIQF